MSSIMDIDLKKVTKLAKKSLKFKPKTSSSMEE